MRVINIIICLAVLYCGVANGSVDPFTGNLSLSHIDYSETNSFLPQPGTIRRTYNSQSNFDGLFGYGWCSNLEHRLEFASKEIKFHFCGSGKITIFKPTERETEFKSESNEVLSRDGSVWNYSIPGKVEHQFNDKGQLTKSTNSIGQSWRLIYSSRKLVQIKFANQTWRVSNKNGKVHEIALGPKESLVYTYNQNQLKKVEIKNLVPLYRYTYYSNSNLKTALYANDDQILVDYNTDDRVKLYRADDGCTYIFSYITKTELNTKSQWQELCPSTRPLTFEASKKVISKFFPPTVIYKQKGSKNILAKSIYKKKIRTLQTVGQGKVQIFKFARDRGLQRIEDRRLKKITQFKIKKRKIASVNIKTQKSNQTWRFEFYKSGKLKKAKNKSRSISFNYDRNGNLISAKEKGFQLKVKRDRNSGSPVKISGSNKRSYFFSNHIPEGFNRGRNSWPLFDKYKEYLNILSLSERRDL